MTISGAPSFAEEIDEQVPLEIVEYGPADPTLNENCEPVDPDPEDLWSYVGEQDPGANTIWVDAFLPEGYQIGVTGQRYWSSVWNGWELTCPVVEPEPEPEPEPQPEPEPVPAEPAPPAAPQPPADVVPVVDTVQPTVASEATPVLAETGVEEEMMLLAATAAAVLLAFGGGIMLFNYRQSRRKTK